MGRRIPVVSRPSDRRSRRNSESRARVGGGSRAAREAQMISELNQAISTLSPGRRAMLQAQQQSKQAAQQAQNESDRFDRTRGAQVEDRNLARKDQTRNSLLQMASTSSPWPGQRAQLQAELVGAEFADQQKIQQAIIQGDAQEKNRIYQIVLSQAGASGLSPEEIQAFAPAPQASVPQGGDAGVTPSRPPMLEAIKESKKRAITEKLYGLLNRVAENTSYAETNVFTGTTNDAFTTAVKGEKDFAPILNEAVRNGVDLSRVARDFNARMRDKSGPGIPFPGIFSGMGQAVSGYKKGWGLEKFHPGLAANELTDLFNIQKNQAQYGTPGQ